jgi:ABC-type Co2+ transport system permease subunit
MYFPSFFVSLLFLDLFVVIYMFSCYFLKKKKEKKKGKISLWPIVSSISSLRQMFKGPSSFKPFVGSLLFGPLLAQFLA